MKYIGTLIKQWLWNSLRVHTGNDLDKNLLEKQIKTEFSNTVLSENYGKYNTTIVVVLLLYHLYRYGFGLGMAYWCLTPLSTICQLYRGDQLVGGKQRNTRRKPPTCRKSLTNGTTTTTPIDMGKFQSKHQHTINNLCR